MIATHDQHAVAAELRKLADLIDNGPPTKRGALQVRYPDGDRASVDHLADALGMEPPHEYGANGHFGYQSGGRNDAPVNVIVACTIRQSDQERRRKLAAELEELDARIAANGQHDEVPA